MNIKISVLISLIILAFGAYIARNFIIQTYLPAMDSKNATLTVVGEEMEQKASEEANAQAATATQEFFSQRSTATAQHIQAIQQEATLEAQLTADAIATIQSIPTEVPSLVFCSATLVGKSDWLSPVPGILYDRSGGIKIPENSPVKIDGALRDSAWVHVSYEGKKGFMRQENLQYEDPECEPVIGDLHYLAGWLEPDRKVLVDDTFAYNQYSWYDQDSNEQILADISSSEAFLPVYAEHQLKVFSTNVLSNAQISSFDLYTYFKIVNQRANSFFGVQFYDNGDSFYEVRLFPDECMYSVYDSKMEEEIVRGNLKTAACMDGFLSLRLIISTKQEMTLNVNGMNIGPTQLPISKDRVLNGGINFSNYLLEANYNFIVVTEMK